MYQRFSCWHLILFINSVNKLNICMKIFDTEKLIFDNMTKGEGKYRSSLRPIPFAYAYEYVLVYVYICCQKFADKFINKMTAF